MLRAAVLVVLAFAVPARAQTCQMYIADQQRPLGPATARTQIGDAVLFAQYLRLNAALARAGLPPIAAVIPLPGDLFAEEYAIGTYRACKQHPQEPLDAAAMRFLAGWQVRAVQCLQQARPDCPPRP